MLITEVSISAFKHLNGEVEKIVEELDRCLGNCGGSLWIVLVFVKMKVFVFGICVQRINLCELKSTMDLYLDKVVHPMDVQSMLLKAFSKSFVKMLYSLLSLLFNMVFINLDLISLSSTGFIQRKRSVQEMQKFTLLQRKIK